MTAKYRPNDADALSIDQRLAIVNLAHTIFGVRTARSLWRSLQLPAIEDDGRRRSRSRDEGVRTVIEAFLAECCRRDPTAEIAAGVLYKAYSHWAARRRMRPMTLVMFGRTIAEAGISKFQRSSIFYEGIVLNEPDLGM